jgi:ribosomal protein S27E
LGVGVAKKKPSRIMYCPHCHAEKVTAALANTRLVCNACGEYFRAAPKPGDDEIPVAVGAGAGDEEREERPPPLDPVEAGRRGGLAGRRSRG